MKKNKRIWVYPLILLGFIFMYTISCEKQSEKDPKLSFKEARKLIEYWIFNDYNPQMNPSLEFFLDEITTDEIWNLLNAQVFIILTDVPGLSNRAVYIENGKVYDLEKQRAFYGAQKLDNLLVTDLDKDDLYELCFTFISGSGIIRTSIACYINDLNHTLLLADTTFISGPKLKLVRENFQNVSVKKITNDGEVNLGNIILVSENDTLKLKLNK